MIATLWSNAEDLQGQELWMINKAIVGADYRKNVLRELNEIGEGKND